MALTVLLVIDLHDTPAEKHAAFADAMVEKGWRQVGGIHAAYRAAFEYDDEQKVLERAKALVTEATRQAGITDYDVACLPSPYQVRKFI